MFGLVTRRRYEEDLAAAKAEANRQRERAETAEGRTATAEYNREQILHQLAGADAANRRLHGRNLELGQRISKLTDADPEYTADLERRVGRLRRVVARVLAAYAEEKRRADYLQRRLDDVFGLNSSSVAAGSAWQERRETRMRFDR